MEPTSSCAILGVINLVKHAVAELNRFHLELYFIEEFQPKTNSI